MKMLAVGCGAILLVGCTSVPYEPGHELETPLTLPLAPGEAQLERGRPNAFVDGLGHYFFSLPSKLLLLSWKMNNHRISPETEASIREYLAANGLCNVKVRLNQYAPGGEWRRLSRNREMPGAWRWTLGLITVGTYTIFPERLFAGFPFIGGGDHYNPFTNTISLYSDRRSVAIHEGGHARDFGEVRNRHWKGLYAAIRIFPLVPLWQEAEASGDALAWEKTYGEAPDEKGAYRALYPAYGTYVGGEASRWVPTSWIVYAVQYGAVVAGHVVGNVRALFVGDRPEPPPMGPLDELAQIRADGPPDRCPTAETAPPLPL